MKNLSGLIKYLVLIIFIINPFTLAYCDQSTDTDTAAQEQKSLTQNNTSPDQQNKTNTEQQQDAEQQQNENTNHEMTESEIEYYNQYPVNSGQAQSPEKSSNTDTSQQKSEEDASESRHKPEWEILNYNITNNTDYIFLIDLSSVNRSGVAYKVLKNTYKDNSNIDKINQMATLDLNILDLQSKEEGYITFAKEKKDTDNLEIFIRILVFKNLSKISKAFNSGEIKSLFLSDSFTTLNFKLNEEENNKIKANEDFKINDWTVELHYDSKSSSLQLVFNSVESSK